MPKRRRSDDDDTCLSCGRALRRRARCYGCGEYLCGEACWKDHTKECSSCVSRQSIAKLIRLIGSFVFFGYIVGAVSRLVSTDALVMVPALLAPVLAVALAGFLAPGPRFLR